MNLGPHAAFIWSAYAAVAVGLGGLLAWLIVDSRRQRAALADLESRGVRRRWSRPAAAKSNEAGEA
jgi:heme exporter protein D